MSGRTRAVMAVLVGGLLMATAACGSDGEASSASSPAVSSTSTSTAVSATATSSATPTPTRRTTSEPSTSRRISRADAKPAPPVATADPALCGPGYPERTPSVRTVVERGPARTVTVCTYDGPQAGRAVRAEPSQVERFLLVAGPDESDACTADAAPRRALAFTYADRTRLFLGLDLPASCQALLGRDGSDVRYLTRAGAEYFVRLVD